MCRVVRVGRGHEEAAIIDPGGDLDQLLAEIERLSLKPQQIWLTRAHIV